MHQLDQLDFEEREIARANTSQSHPRGELVVLRKTSIYASMTMVLGGREHELPIIEVSCIEELYRTGKQPLLTLDDSFSPLFQGIYQPNLFRTLPNRSRLLELINIFDSEQQPPGSIIRSRQSLPPKSPIKSGYGANTSLHLESTPDICALLPTYLSALPEPILLPALFRPIWDWCGLENAEAERLQSKPFQRRISSVPLLRTYTNTTESTPILTAQRVLHLLPSPHFSLLVYVLASFSQVALVHEENGVGMEDLARMFGGRIFGGGQSRRRKLLNEIANGDAHEPRTEGEVMMCWFLRRWGPISDSLFDVIEDAKMGVLQDQQQDRLRSLQKRCAVLVDNAGIPNHSSGRDTPFRLPVQDDVLCSGESPPRLKHDEEEGAFESGVKDYGDDSFNIPTADGESVYSATALDERLLDVSISTLLDQTFSIESLDDDGSRSILPPTIPKPEEDKTCHRILVLEAELEKSNKAVTESVHELSKEKQSRLDLENRVGELEMALRMERKKKGGGVDLDGDEGAAAVLKKERDDALDLVREIRKLML